MVLGNVLAKEIKQLKVPNNLNKIVGKWMVKANKGLRNKA